MAKITSKGQVTIPEDIREKFALLPGTEVDIITEKESVLIVKRHRENVFLKWLGRGKRRARTVIDRKIDQLRGRTDA
jgi:AbrB family looped-hinge helix DNA binding protein